ncbi:hypothetical protein AAMO2058_001104700, partial [Amorphochlora amoebiformis]
MTSKDPIPYVYADLHFAREARSAKVSPAYVLSSGTCRHSGVYLYVGQFMGKPAYKVRDSNKHLHYNPRERRWEIDDGLNMDNTIFAYCLDPADLPEDGTEWRSYESKRWEKMSLRFKPLPNIGSSKIPAWIKVSVRGRKAKFQQGYYCFWKLIEERPAYRSLKKKGAYNIHFSVDQWIIGSKLDIGPTNYSHCKDLCYLPTECKEGEWIGPRDTDIVTCTAVTGPPRNLAKDCEYPKFVLKAVAAGVPQAYAV